MFYKFVFFFHIFVLEDNGLVSQIDSQFVFPSEEACRIVEAFVHNTRDKNNCVYQKVLTSNNNAKDNLNLLLSQKNS